MVVGCLCIKSIVFYFDFGFGVVEGFEVGHFEDERSYGGGCFEEEVEICWIRKNIVNFGYSNL